MRWMAITLAVCYSAGAQETENVEGRVLNGATKEGIEGALVALVRSDKEAPAQPGSIWALPLAKGDTDYTAPRLLTKTDVSGGFRLVVEKPATFHLFLNKPGYTGAENSGIEWSTNRKDDALQRIEFLIYPEAQISGRVVDRATDEPVSGLFVYAEKRTDVVGGKVFLPTGLSSPIAEDGSFEIKKLGPGEYRLAVQPPSGVRKAQQPADVEDFVNLREEGYVRTYYPGAVDETQAGTIAVEAGASSTGVTIKLERRRIASIRGRLTGPESATGANLQLVEIKASRTATSFSAIGSGKWPIGERFGFSRLSPGTYALYASLEKTADRPRMLASRIFEVEDRNIDNLDLALTTGLRLTGSVRMDGVDGPLPKGIRVSLAPLRRTGGPGYDDGKVDEASGRFQIDGLEPFRGIVTVNGLPRGYRLAEVIYNDSPAPFHIFALTPQATEHRLALKLAPAAGSLQVTVRDGSNAVSGAMVMLVSDGAGEEALMTAMRRVKTDAEGRASIPELLPGLYRVLAFAPGASWTADPYLVHRLNNARDVRVPAGATSLTLGVQ